MNYRKESIKKQLKNEREQTRIRMSLLTGY